MTMTYRQVRDFMLLLLWGFFVLKLAACNQLSSYLHPTLQPYTITAGVLLLIMAAFILRSILKRKGVHGHSCCLGHVHEETALEEHSHADHDHGDHVHDQTDEGHFHGEQSHEHDHTHGEADHHGCSHHDHSHEEEVHHDHENHDHEKSGMGFPSFASLLFKTLLLLLPLAMICFSHASQYSLTTIQNRGVVQDISNLPAAKASSEPVPAAASAAGDDSGQETTTNGIMPAQVIDLLYAVQMPSYREDFEGKQVEMVGQFVPLTTGNPKGDRFQMIRLFITCCAADAKPVGVTVQYDKPLKVAEMGWLKITGTPTFPMEGGRRTAVLIASKVEECPAPAEPFVY